MQKRISILLVALCGLFVIPHSLSAQTYERMLADVQDAARRDLPQTALQHARRMAVRAEAEGQTAWLLRAMMLRLWLHEDLSADSARIDLTQLRRMAAAEQRPVERALWHVVTGHAEGALQADTAAQARARRCFDTALADLRPLAEARTDAYQPLFVKGRDSRLYADDLLSVVLRSVTATPVLDSDSRAALQGRARRLYDTMGRRDAALLCAIDSVQQALAAEGHSAEAVRSAGAALRRLAEQYAGAEAAVEIYIAYTHLPTPYGTADDAAADRLAMAREGLERYSRQARAAVLRQYIARAEQPMMALHTPSEVLLPGSPTQAVLRHRNVRQCRLRFLRLKNVNAADRRLADRRFKGIGTTTVATQTFVPTAEAPAHVTQTDTVSICLDQPGIYMVELLADGKRVGQELLYVSGVYPLLTHNTPDGTRLLLLDAHSGAPLQGGRVEVRRLTETGSQQVAAYDADSRGRIFVPAAGHGAGVRTCYVRVGTDAYHPAVYLYPDYRRPYTQPTNHTTATLFTDRAIYRPGQTVQVSGLVYTQQGDDVRVATGYTDCLLLSDARGKEVAHVEVKTDSFGVFTATFPLPAVCLPGAFTLRGTKGGWATVRVEAYKRPTFEVNMLPVDGGYRAGDSVWVRGTVKTYTGMPLADCRVRYDVQQREGWVRQAPAGGRRADVVTGEVQTDSTGAFAVPVVLQVPADGPALWRRFYDVAVAVTAANGETAEARTTLPLASRRAWLSADLPAVVCREQARPFTVRQTNAMGQAIDGRAVWTLTAADGRQVAAGTLTCGTPVMPAAWLTLPSGRYEATFTLAGTDTLHHTLTLFSEADRRPAAPEPLFIYERMNAAGDTCHLWIGSSLPEATLFADAFTASGSHRADMLTVADSLLHLVLAWQTADGDAATHAFALVNEGKLYTHTVRLRRPQPDKRLLLRWTSFRDHTVPGQHEIWRLRLNHPDGRPADAHLMARLYDASLDALQRQPWQFGLYFPRTAPALRTAGPVNGAFFCQGFVPRRTIHTPSLTFTRWQTGVIGRYVTATTDDLAESLTVVENSKALVMPRMSRATAKEATMRLAGTAVADESLANEKGTGSEEADADAGAALAADALRSRFAETAYFNAALRTDARGEVTMEFTLPEALTSWSFTALGHTRQMDYGRLDTLIVARKMLMATAALPRYVRTGDRVTLPVSVQNLAGSPVSGTLTAEVLDAATGRRLLRQRLPFADVAPQGTQTLRFTVDVPQTTALDCRFLAEGDAFSDGEAHLLPVLADAVETVRSVAFTLDSDRPLTLRLDTLWRGSKGADNARLTVETSANPLWYAVASLPALTQGEATSATEWARRYYAVTLAARMVRDMPALATAFDAPTAEATSPLLRNDDVRAILEAETPWAARLDSEAQRREAMQRLFDDGAIAATQATAVERLLALQTAEGGWSWYPGMPANAHITAEVAVLLARLYHLTGDATLRRSRDRAMTWLAAEMAREVKARKAAKSEAALGMTALRYLYARALMGQKPDADARYLMACAQRRPLATSLHEKAMLAVVMARSGEQTEAATLCRSLLEHTVTAPAMGRWFDSRRAPLTRESYRIPTQTAAIEALMLVGGDDNRRAADEMRRWLMQAKRTQHWQGSTATADAVYALLAQPEARQRLKADGDTAVVYHTLLRGRRILDANDAASALAPQTVGYTCRRWTGDTATTATDLTLRRAGSKTPAWGSVTARFTTPVAAAVATANGLAVERRYEVRRGGQWALLHEGEAVRPGEQVRQVTTVTADRDYDLVALKVARPAHLQPAQPLSTTVWDGGLCAYRAVRDAATTLYIDHLPKGRHTFTEVYVADRTGCYQSGVTTVTCTYAPEFAGQTAGYQWGQRK